MTGHFTNNKTNLEAAGLTKLPADARHQEQEQRVGADHDRGDRGCGP